MSSLEHLSASGPIWSPNEREARLFAGRLELQVEADDYAGICEVLSGRFGAMLARVEGRDSWFSDGDVACHTPSILVTSVDTNGTGDTHSNVLAAALARGVDLTAALHWANATEALTATHPGPATCPTEAEVRTLAQKVPRSHPSWSWRGAR